MHTHFASAVDAGRGLWGLPYSSHTVYQYNASRRYVHRTMSLIEFCVVVWHAPPQSFNESAAAPGVHCLAVLPHGVLACGMYDGTVRLWV